MRRKIPGTRALLAFEAAAKHGHFGRAAQELSLTEGAVSRQITRLESMLDCLLFERTGSRVKLNPSGARYAQQIRETLERLERDTQSIMGMPAESKSLDIAALPTFSARWLIPRLAGFYTQHPDITVNIAARTEPFILADSGFDAVVHFDHPAWTGMKVEFLFNERLVPVCHPSLLKRQGQRVSLNDLPLIHRRQNLQAWQHYANETGIALDNPMQGVRYDLHEMAIAAALSGQGVALVPRLYIGQELNRGELVIPWPESASLSKTFCLVKTPETGTHQIALNTFEHWLRTEIEL